MGQNTLENGPEAEMGEAGLWGAGVGERADGECPCAFENVADISTALGVVLALGWSREAWLCRLARGFGQVPHPLWASVFLLYSDSRRHKMFPGVPPGTPVL